MKEVEEIPRLQSPKPKKPRNAFESYERVMLDARAYVRGVPPTQVEDDPLTVF